MWKSFTEIVVIRLIRLEINHGDRYGRWTIIEEVKRARGQKGSRHFMCVCDCGTTRRVSLSHMKQGLSKSCGCLSVEVSTQKATKHGLSYNPMYGVWEDMIRRCTNPKYPRFDDWGGRGITVCREWMIFEKFVIWGESSGYKVNLLIERIDNDEGYSPDNCKWATMKEQGNNRRNNRLVTHLDETLTVTQWADRIGISHSGMCYRLIHWDLPRALKAPINLNISNGMKRRFAKNGCQDIS